MTTKTPSELTRIYVAPFPADLYVPVHSATSGAPAAGKVLATDLAGSGGGALPATTPPLPSGTTALTGSSLLYARADHVHLRATAAEIASTPAGTVSATNVQAAITELDTEKQAVSAKGAASGYAPLDSSSLVPVANLPSRAATAINVTATGAIAAGNLQVTLGGLDTRISALTQSLTLAGTYNAATDTVTAIAGQGLSNGPLPVPAVGNTNRYLIVNVGGTGINNAAGMGTIVQGNWVYSNGTVWTELDIASSTVDASNVTCTPTGAIGAVNVQAAIAELEVEKCPVVRGVLTTDSLQGGGSFSSNRTLSLVGDTASPGVNKVYGTDSGGTRGWKDDPAGGGGVTKLPFIINAASLPVVLPAMRAYTPGVTANGVQYPSYQFSGSADTTLDLFGLVDAAYADGNVNLKFHMYTDSSTGTVTWNAAFCRLNASVDPIAAFTFSFQSTTASLPSQQRALQLVTLTFTKAQANSIAAGDPFVLRIKRLGSDTNTAVVHIAQWTLNVREA